MSSPREYIYTVIIAAIFVSVLQSILPGKGATSAIIHLIAGIFLLTVVISPLIKIRINRMLDYISCIETDASSIVSSAQNSTLDEIDKVIIQKAEAYILDKANNLGVNIAVEISLKSDGSSIPERIKIIGPVSPQVKKQLSALITNDLGISGEMQTWVLT